MVKYPVVDWHAKGRELLGEEEERKRGREDRESFFLFQINFNFSNKF